MSPSSSTSTATSHSSESDVSMLSSDYSSLEAHNDMIISDYISKYRSDDAKPTTELYKPAMPTDAFDSTVRKYPMSDEAKKILRTLPTSIAIKLRLHGQPFPSATISSVSSGSVSSTMFKDT
ncbi:predicted protein [Lichtheimia corymbifera JMRC:FSU:9682]|nr:predicted protein [Lichtheimia corymbifera JMRC:FSU:9682]